VTSDPGGQRLRHPPPLAARPPQGHLSHGPLAAAAVDRDPIRRAGGSVDDEPRFSGTPQRTPPSTTRRTRSACCCGSFRWPGRTSTSGSSVSPERSRKELGLIADFIAQLNDREHEAAASRRVLIGRQINNTRYLGSGKTQSAPEALLACRDVVTTLEGGSAPPTLERMRKPLTSLRERRWHDTLRRSGLRL
jgi:hypothetical protein